MSILVITISLGIRWMIIGQIIGNVLTYLIISFKAGLVIGYSFKEQISDLYPSLLFSAAIGTMVYLVQLGLASVSPLLQLVLLCLLSLSAVHILATITGNQQYKIICREIGTSAVRYFKRNKLK